MSSSFVARAAAIAALSGAAVLVAPSCTSVLSLDGFTDASATLCAMLRRCYGKHGFKDCDQHVGDRLEASPTRASTWLDHFGKNHCLANCSSARSCLDVSPVCEPPGQACGKSEECCGFTTGLGDCDAAKSRCCRPRGVACKADDDCCTGAGSCDPDKHTCGGVVCKPAGDACVNDFECCTQRCDPKIGCLEDTCFGDGFPCQSDGECCSQRCDPVTSQCGVASCHVDGDTCFFDGDCCSGHCTVEVPNSPGVCGVPSCLPEKAACSDPSQCCTGYCDPTFLLCGYMNACKPDGEPCGVDTECCGLSCNMGLCGTACAPSGCDHSVCATGGPLGAGCPCPSEPCTVDAACVTAVCAADTYCCCTAWDATCVAEVPAFCSVPCAVTQ